MAIEATFYTESFIVGFYHGFSKPEDASFYISPFVEDMKEIFSTGIIIYEKKINIIISAFICDAPARAFLTLTKHHSEYFSCSKCCQEEEYDGRVYFPELNSALRTNESFKNMSQE